MNACERVRKLAIIWALGAAGCGGEWELGEVQEVTSEILFNGHDYGFFQNAQNWPSAQAICRNSFGGHLVSINSAEENDFVKVQAVLHGGGVWWTGYSDWQTEGLWVWDRDPQVGYLNWAPGEPNNYMNEDQGTIDSNTGLWNDVKATNTFSLRYVCERESGPANPETMFEYIANDTNSDTRGYKQFAVNLGTHQTVTLGTCGLFNATFTGDTYLRLFWPNGTTELASNDDACNGLGPSTGLGSNISAFVPVVGQYIIHAGCYDDTACTGRIVITTGPVPF